MQFFVIVRNKQKSVIDEAGPFEHLHSALAYAVEKSYLTLPDRPEKKAYAELDIRGLAQLLFTRAIAGPKALRSDVLAIWIRRDDYHLAYTVAEKDIRQKH